MDAVIVLMDEYTLRMGVQSLKERKNGSGLGIKRNYAGKQRLEMRT